MIFLLLFWEFFKVGLFSVGGGLATIPFLQDLGDRMGWFGPADLANMIAVSESTPGPMGVNMSTYVGYQCGLTEGGLGIPGGILGAVVGVLGLVTPSIIVILIVAGFLKKFRDSKVVNGIFTGLRPASIALITSAGLSVAGIALFRGGALGLGTVHWPAVAICAAVLACLHIPKLKQLHPILYIAIAALLGVLLQL